MQSGVPIKPSDIPAAKAAVIPAFVIDAFNECIAKNFFENKACFTETEVRQLIELRCTNSNIKFDSRFLKSYKQFESHGWYVKHDEDAKSFLFADINVFRFEAFFGNAK